LQKGGVSRSRSTPGEKRKTPTFAQLQKRKGGNQLFYSGYLLDPSGGRKKCQWKKKEKDSPGPRGRGDSSGLSPNGGGKKGSIMFFDSQGWKVDFRKGKKGEKTHALFCEREKGITSGLASLGPISSQCPSEEKKNRSRYPGKKKSRDYAVSVSRHPSFCKKKGDKQQQQREGKEGDPF